MPKGLPKDRPKTAKGSPNGDAPFWAKIENCMFLEETDVLRNKIKLYSLKKVIEIKNRESAQKGASPMGEKGRPLWAKRG